MILRPPAVGLLAWQKMRNRHDSAVGPFGTPPTVLASRDQIRGLLDEMRAEDRATREMDPNVFRALLQEQRRAEAAQIAVEAAPIEVDPAPVEEAGAEAALVEARLDEVFGQAAPVEAAIVEAAPIEASPIEASPIEEPVEAASIEAALIEASPIEEPVEAAPVETPPVEASRSDTSNRVRPLPQLETSMQIWMWALLMACVVTSVLAAIVLVS